MYMTGSWKEATLNKAIERLLRHWAHPMRYGCRQVDQQDSDEDLQQYVLLTYFEKKTVGLIKEETYFNNI